MNIQIVFKQMDHSDSLEAYAKEKSDRLSKYFDGKFNITWNFRKEHNDFIAHCHTVGSHIDFFGEGSDHEAYTSIDQAYAKLEKQLKKHKEIVTAH